MKRYLKVLALLALTSYFTSCKKDDGPDVAPPRDYTLQYATEKVAIENFLHEYAIQSVDADMNIKLIKIPTPNTENLVSIWDQTTYPLQSKDVTSNGVTYKLYYLVLNQGVGKMPTRADNILAAYEGRLMDETMKVFDQNPFPQTFSALDSAIEGWQEIIPLFNSGVLADSNPQDPAKWENFGAGMMFIPSGLAYYNYAQTGIPAYSPLIFSFKLNAVEYLDTDGDGILNKDEKGTATDIKFNDTDGDGTPDYRDTDDDNDGYLTKTEIGYTSGTPVDYASIPVCNEATAIKKHLDPACH